MREEHIRQRIEDFHAARLNCAETVLTVFCEETGIEGAFYPRIATALGAGLSRRQELCGAVSGALMAIGLVLGREIGGEREPAYRAGNEFMTWFEEKFGSKNCREIIGHDLSNPDENTAFRAPGGKHETICEPMVAEVIRRLLDLYG